MLTTVSIAVASLGSLAFGAALFVVLIAAFEGGRRTGLRRASEEAAREGGGVIIGSMLGLLGFVLALTLSYASARFEERRQGTLAEANAIGTAWLRAMAVGHPKGPEIAAQIREYADLRLAFVQAEARSPELAEINRRTATLQTGIWRNLTVITQERTDAVAGYLMASLNEAFDRATASRFGFALGVPPQILLLITSMPTIALAALGFHLGLRRDTERLLPAVLSLMLTAVVTLVLDLGAPRFGDLRPSARAYEWTIGGFAPGPGGPPTQAPR